MSAGKPAVAPESAPAKEAAEYPGIITEKRPNGVTWILHNGRPALPKQTMRIGEANVSYKNLGTCIDQLTLADTKGRIYNTQLGEEARVLVYNLNASESVWPAVLREDKKYVADIPFSGTHAKLFKLNIRDMCERCKQTITVNIFWRKKPAHNAELYYRTVGGNYYPLFGLERLCCNKNIARLFVVTDEDQKNANELFPLEHTALAIIRATTAIDAKEIEVASPAAAVSAGGSAASVK